MVVLWQEVVLQEYLSKAGVWMREVCPELWFVLVFEEIVAERLGLEESHRDLGEILEAVLVHLLPDYLIYWLVQQPAMIPHRYQTPLSFVPVTDPHLVFQHLTQILVISEPSVQSLYLDLA